MVCRGRTPLLSAVPGGRASRRYVHVCGKGGREGQTFMMQRAIDMLKAQGHTGDASSILIVGDRYDTDIRAGVQAGIKTCLVESGCHSVGLQPNFPRDRAHFVARSVKELIPHQFVRSAPALLLLRGFLPSLPSSSPPCLLSPASSRARACRLAPDGRRRSAPTSIVVALSASTPWVALVSAGARTPRATRSPGATTVSCATGGARRAAIC